jgi:hypothetical protein
MGPNEGASANGKPIKTWNPEYDVVPLGHGRASGQVTPGGKMREIKGPAADQYMEVAELVSAEPDMQKRMEAIMKLNQDGGFGWMGDDIIAIAEMAERMSGRKGYFPGE